MKKRITLLLAALLVASLLLTACGGSTAETESPATEEPAADPSPLPTEKELETAPTEEAAPAATEPEEAPVPTDAPVEEPTEEDTTLTGTVNKDTVCYQQPNKDVVGTVKAGVTVTILGRNVGAGWLAINYPVDETRMCWIADAVVDYEGEYMDIPIYGRSEEAKTEEGEEIVLEEGYESLVLVDVACLAGPGGSYGQIRTLLAGQTVIVFGKGIGAGWYVVQVPTTGDKCWVTETAIDFQGDEADLRIMANPPK
ncbi:MAG: hypothetical protein OEZ02_01065 [Anaerolineae bacterium]|nr:hypothetical protein [Anaerolineae bacterium]